MAPNRRILAVRISDEARTAIENHCRSNGISITAWIEAVGKRIEEIGNGQPHPSLDEVSKETLRLAREIDARRRARPRS